MGGNLGDYWLVLTIYYLLVNEGGESVDALKASVPVLAGGYIAYPVDEFRIGLSDVRTLLRIIESHRNDDDVRGSTFFCHSYSLTCRFILDFDAFLELHNGFTIKFDGFSRTVFLFLCFTTDLGIEEGFLFCQTQECVNLFVVEL